MISETANILPKLQASARSLTLTYETWSDKLKKRQRRCLDVRTPGEVAFGNISTDELGI